MRRRLPSPALVIASIALFLALAGTGAATEFAILRTGHPTRLVSGNVSTDGKVVGSGLTGGRKSAGVYTLTVTGNTFARKPFVTGQAIVSPIVLEAFVNGRVVKVPPSCDVAAKSFASNGSAKAEVDCFTYGGSTGWVPTDASFDFQMTGPSR
jgi:hypothetical protein